MKLKSIRIRKINRTDNVLVSESFLPKQTKTTSAVMNHIADTLGYLNSFKQNLQETDTLNQLHTCTRFI